MRLRFFLLLSKKLVRFSSSSFDASVSYAFMCSDVDFPRFGIDIDAPSSLPFFRCLLSADGDLSRFFPLLGSLGSLVLTELCAGRDMKRKLQD